MYPLNIQSYINNSYLLVEAYALKTRDKDYFFLARQNIKGEVIISTAISKHVWYIVLCWKRNLGLSASPHSSGVWIAWCTKVLHCNSPIWMLQEQTKRFLVCINIILFEEDYTINLLFCAQAIHTGELKRSILLSTDIHIPIVWTVEQCRHNQTHLEHIICTDSPA